MADEAEIGVLKAIAHPLRFAILEAIAGGERNVGEIESATGIAQPTLSQQLQVLRKAGLVSTRRVAKMVYYNPDGEKLAAARSLLDAVLPAQPAAAAERIAAHRRSIGAAVFAQIERD
jgi:DNA-binding transcriptional ArsR family regulator